ncbi:hypothetical protein V2W45_1233832, partial [Cenococcum geophilum]
GILYLRRITDAHLRGSGLRDLGLCKQIVRREKFNSVVMITTVWGKVDLDGTRDRECEHYDTPQFWSDLRSGGCAAWPLCAGSTSAKQIIACIANPNKRLKLKNPTADGR